jgi:hypothetical protein
MLTQYDIEEVKGHCNNLCGLTLSLCIILEFPLFCCLVLNLMCFLCEIQFPSKK